MTAESQQKHKLGLRGNFAISPVLQSTAGDHGLQIFHLGAQKYEIRHQSPDFQAGNLYPSSVGDAGSTLTLSQLKQTLEFLHQPLRISAEKFTELRQQTHENRVSLHQLLRFVTTGLVQLNSSEETTHTGPCHHDESNRKMHDRDSWREQAELGNPHDVKTAIPRTGIDPQNGFFLTVHEDLLQNAGKKSDELKTIFWALVSDIKQKDFSHKPPVIFLTATELEELSQKILHLPNIKMLLQNIKLEELQLEADRDITARQQELPGANEPSFSGHNSYQREIDLLLRSTTALTPLISSSALENAWKKFHWTKRNDSPFPKIMEEMAVLGEQLRQEQERPHTDPARSEALHMHFASLISFLRLTAREMDWKNIEEMLSENPANLYVAEEFLEPHHRQALELIRKSMERGGSPFKQLLNGVGDSLVTVVKEGYNFTTESKRRLRALTAATALYMISIPVINNPDMMQKLGLGHAHAAEQQQSLNDDTMMQIPVIGDDENLQIGNTSKDSLPKIVPSTTSDTTPSLCHPHVGRATVVMHCYFNDLIKDFMAGSVNKIDNFSDQLFVKLGINKTEQAAFSGFSQNARAAIGPTANFWLYCNLAQLMAHVPFFAMMLSRGRRHGIHAYKETHNLIGEFSDSLWSLMKYRPLALPAATTAAGLTAMNSADITTILLSTALAGFAGNKLWTRSPGTSKELEELSRDIATVQSITDARIARDQIAQVLPENAETLNVHFAGLKQKFLIGAHNLQPLLSALNKFDSAITHAATQIGTGEPWYQDFLKGRVEQATQALRKYETDKNTEILHAELDQSLADIMGAQARHTGQSPVYNVLAGGNTEPEALHLITRHGNIKHAALGREESIKHHFERLKNPEEQKFFPRLESRIKSGAALAGNGLWHAIASGSRKTQMVYEATPHKGLIIGSFATAAGTLIGLDLSGQGHALMGTDVGNAIQTTSGHLGTAYGTTGTTGAFGIYNIWDDTILTDTGGGLIALTAGVVSYYAWRNGAKPLAASSMEKITPAIEKFQSWRNDLRI